MKTKICLVIMTLLLILSGCGKKEEEKKQETISDYEQYLFDTSYVHEIDVSISEENWNDLLSHPADKSKYTADITIDGETYQDVSFSTKGNSSLMFVANDENSDRYSFKVNFGKNIDGQTYHGLSKLSLNNLFSDTAYMKDFLSYEIFRKADVNAPLYSYVWLRINGKDHGLYGAVEDIGKSFLKRNYNGKGVLYKPESEGISLSPEDIEEFLNGASVPTGEANGADLVYCGEEIESYSAIFDNAETSAEEEDYRRVVEALEALNENRDLEQYLDTDEIIRYFAANVFLLNYDGYIGPMLHNYYLYENEGKLAMLPWDYNLAFATTSILIPETDYADPGRLINQGIDTPLYLTGEEERPMWSWIVKSEEYLNRYHESFDAIVDYIASGDFETEADRIHAMLREYVEKDPTAFFTTKQFEKGYEAMKQFCFVRAASIQKQLNGTLSTHSSEQDPSDWADASGIDLLDMN